VTRAQRNAWLGLVLGAALIWLVFSPSLAGPRFAFDPRPPIVLPLVLVLVGALGLGRWHLGGFWRWLLALVLLLAAMLQFADGAVQRILDRPLDLYFDLRHVPNLLGLYLDAAGHWRGGAVIAVVALALLLGLALLARSLGAMAQATWRPTLAAGTIAVGLVGLILAALPLGPAGIVNRGAAVSAWRQAALSWREFAVLHGIDRRYAAALAAPQPEPGKLPGLDGHDFYLIYVESYGTVGLDEAPYRQVLAPALADFAATVTSAGYDLAASRYLSPTFGGGSWLAHGTMASGVKLDQLLSELVVNGDRKGLPRYLAAAGYRTVEVMPGIKDPYPEGAFWGFDAHYYAAELGYPGPEFGWFDIPDQYTLREFAARELKPGHAPLFAQIVLVSSHTPFAPVPPYLSDWSDAGAFASVPAKDWPRIYAQPDWNDLDRPYLDSIAYDLKTLSQWLAGLDGSPLVIILGDHQPPDLTRGAGERWTVPVYVLSRDAALLRPFEAQGFVAGDDPPPRDDPPGMENFLGDFLAAYGPNSAPAPESALQQSPDAPAPSPP
jgi:hypothetical protein